jgi:hypothetical protein
MTRFPRRPAILVGLTGLLAAAFAATGSLVPAAASVASVTTGAKPAHGPASAGDSGHVAVHETSATTANGRREVLAHWTEQRMRDAVPVERLLDRSALRRSGGEVAKGEPSVIQPTLTGILDALPLALPELGGPWPGGGEVTSTAGRVFFDFQGSPASCSGDAVSSANESVVITAGHCVKYQGSWHTNWVFVPGYDQGERPHGTWTAEATLTTPQWEASEDLDYDVGAAVVVPRGGESLTDAVGGQGIAFNQSRGQAMYAFGYPAASPYDGEELIYCSGSTIDDPLGSNDLGLACDMTGGSSGGPWFLSFDEASGAGIQNSVNSFGYVILPNVMWGPYFGAEAEALYEAAAAR